MAAFAEALIPRGGPIPHSASDVGVAERVDAALATFDPIVRKRFSRLIGLWDWLAVFSRYLRPFSRLSPQAQAAFCDRASRSRSPVHRNTFTFLKLMCLNQWASTPPVEDAMGFTYACVTKDPPRDGEALEVLSWPAIDRDHSEDADAVVIGSGAGGAAVAKELAEAGLSVVVLEEGGYFTRKDFTGPPWERLQRFYRANGSTLALGVPTIPLPLGKAVGGTTLINSGTCFRTPDRVLEAWGSRFGIEGIDPGSMRPFFDRVERIMHVKPVPEELLGENARVFRRGVQALGLHGEPIRRNIDGCRGCGVCAFGCPSDAKQATHISYLPRAQKHGTSIYVHTRAERILVEDGRARGVVASLLDPDQRRAARAAHRQCEGRRRRGRRDPFAGVAASQRDRQPLRRGRAQPPHPPGRRDRRVDARGRVLLAGDATAVLRRRLARVARSDDRGDVVGAGDRRGNDAGIRDCSRRSCSVKRRSWRRPACSSRTRRPDASGGWATASRS